MGIIAGLLSLLFPETLNVKLPDTIEEAENIGRIMPGQKTIPEHVLKKISSSETK
jgi:hypothetical protein